MTDSIIRNVQMNYLRCSVGRNFSLSYSQSNKERQKGKEQYTDSNIQYMCPSNKGSPIQYGLKISAHCSEVEGTLVIGVPT